MPWIVLQEQIDLPDSDSAQHCFNDLADISGASMQQIESEMVLSKLSYGMNLASSFIVCPVAIARYLPEYITILTVSGCPRFTGHSRSARSGL